MNKKIILTGIASLVVAACARPSNTPAPPGPNPQGCSSVQLNLTLKLNSINLVPAQPKCVKANTEYTIKIHTPGNQVAIGPGDVRTTPKPDNPAWLIGSNTADVSESKFTVASDVSVGDTFEYYVTIIGLGELDPIVKVVSHAMYLKASEWDQKHHDKGSLDLPAVTTKD